MNLGIGTDAAHFFLGGHKSDLLCSARTETYISDQAKPSSPPLFRREKRQVVS
jgi:hypothetical protein